MTGHDIIALGCPQGKCIGLALTLAQNLAEAGWEDHEVRRMMREVIDDPTLLVHMEYASAKTLGIELARGRYLPDVLEIKADIEATPKPPVKFIEHDGRGPG